MWCTSPPAVAVRHVTYGVVFFFGPVIMLSEIPKFPTDKLVRGFSTVWKLLLLHNSLPRREGGSLSLNLLSLFLSFIFCPTSF